MIRTAPEREVGRDRNNKTSTIGGTVDRLLNRL